MEQATAPTNQTNLRVSNAWRVLRCARELGATSRARLAAETGLTQTTVHRIIEDLQKRKLLLSIGTDGRGGVGRPSTLFRFNANVGHVIGIDVGNETTRVAAADLNAATLAEVQRPTASVEADLIGGLERLAREAETAAGVRVDTLVGVGVGVAGVTGAGGTIVRPSVHRLWQGIPLGQLRRSLGCEVAVAQDDHLAALAELHHGESAGYRTALILNVGKGVGLGLIVDGEIHYGARSAAGRIAWIPFSDGEVSNVPVGDLITADGLIADYLRAGGKRQPSGALDVFEADAAGEAAAGVAIECFAARVGWLIATAIAMLDPQIVVLGGGISGSFVRLAPGVQRRIEQIIPEPPPIVASRLGTEAVVCGAIDAALDVADAWLLARVGA